MRGVQKKEKKDEIVSVRVSSQLKEFLIKDSMKKGLSLGVNIEKILAEQQKWENFSRQIMLIETSREVFIQLLNSLSDKKLKEIGRNTLAPFVETSIIFENGKLNLENLFSIYERWIDFNLMHSKHLEVDGVHSFIFKHHLGKSFAKLNYEAWNVLTDKLGFKIKPKEISDTLLVFDIISKK